MKKSIKIMVYEKYNKHCAYCGKEIRYKDMQVDHLTPLNLVQYYRNNATKKFIGALGDNVNSFENLMPSCRRCNHYKRAKRLEDYRDKLKTIHERIECDYIVKVALDYKILNFEKWDGIFYFERVKELKQ